MRKKDLLSQNISLFDKLQRLQIELKKLKDELDQKDSRITELEGLLADNMNESNAVLLQEIADEVEIVSKPEIKIDDSTDYGSKVIGKIVISASEHCDLLTRSAKPQCRELVNLIMGKTELSKSEILDAVNTELSFDDKRKIIDSVYENTLEYFGSIMAQ